MPRDVFQSANKATTYGEFEVQREQRHGKNSDSTYDANSGYSPLTRWFAQAFTYEDFTSNPEGRTGQEAQIQVPRGSIILRCFVRVDTLFTGSGNSDIDVGDSDDADGWLDGVDFSSTGLKMDCDADYNWHLNGTGRYYSNGKMIKVLMKNATAPTTGEAILFLEIVSYHEDLSKEW